MQDIKKLRDILATQRGKLQALDSKKSELLAKIPELTNALQEIEIRKREVSIAVALEELPEKELDRIIKEEGSARQEILKSESIAEGIAAASVDLKNLIQKTEQELLAAELDLERLIFERKKTEIVKLAGDHVWGAYAVAPLYSNGPYPHSWQKFLHEVFGDPPAFGEVARIRAELLK